MCRYIKLLKCQLERIKEEFSGIKFQIGRTKMFFILVDIALLFFKFTSFGGVANTKFQNATQIKPKK